jgi:hypothetical protein
MYTRKYQDVVEFLDNLTPTSFLIVEKAHPIEKMHIQSLMREIDGKDLNFISIRNIQINEKERRKGTMSFILEKMKKSGLNVWVDDIINDDFFNYLISEGYTALFYEKQNCKIRAAYLIQEME